MLYLGFRVWKNRRTRVRQKLADAHLLVGLMDEHSERALDQRFWACWMGVLLLVLAAANPQLGGKAVTVQQRGLDVVLALDLSDSMLAEDLPPSRLERAKRWAQGLVEAISGNRIGLVVFAGDAFLEDALTLDYRHLITSLRAQRTSGIPQQGTDLAAALNEAIDAFPEERKNQRTVVLLTDGEDHEGGLEEALDRAEREGVIVFTVSVGSSEGGQIPVFFRGQRDFKRDESGQVVVTRPNLEVLRQIANETGGTYFDLRAGEAAYEAIDQRLAQLQKQDFAERLYSDYESYFQWLLLPALILFGFAFLRSFPVVRPTKVAVGP